MTKFNIQLACVLIAGTVLTGCSNQQSADGGSKAVLDTVSLSSKNYALAYQDGEKIVATSIDTMKQISFGGATDPAISPDGNKLAYTLSDSAGHRSIWVADMENKSQGQLRVNNYNYFQAMWSADGNIIAFNILKKQGLWKIGIIKADNSGYVMLDSASNINVYGPTWKNKKEIIGHDMKNLYTFDISGKLINTQSIAGLIGSNFFITPRSRFFYTLDGKKIVFNAGSAYGTNESKEPLEVVYIFDAGSKKSSQISPDGINVRSVFVTADNRIFYGGTEKPSRQSKIYVSDLNGNSKVVVDKGTNPTGALK